MAEVTTNVDRHLEEIAEQGFTLLESVIEPDLVDALNEALLRLERELGSCPGANAFEGDHTIRIYNLLARDRVFEQVPVHAAVLPIVERVRAVPPRLQELAGFSTY